MNFKWKILDIYANGDNVTSARYHVSLSDGESLVETEGNWYFDGAGDIPFDKITEDLVIEWIQRESTQNGVNPIKCRLEEQLAGLSKSRQVQPPWKPKTFKISL